MLSAPSLFVYLFLPMRTFMCTLLADDSHLSELAHVPDAYDLVSLMTARDPELRPSAGEVCKHPFFWDEEKRLSFLLEFSDRLEQVCCSCVYTRVCGHACYVVCAMDVCVF